jgi:aspartate ammonia-lyase
MTEPRRYWGPETDKALANFGRGKIPRALLAAYARVKLAALSAVQETESRFPPELFSCIVDALGEIASGALDTSFPLPLKQGGAGTSLNMNVNEVASARAGELYLEREALSLGIDPFEDLNRHQSTNDTFPSALTIAAYEAAVRSEALVVRLQDAFAAREREFETVLVAGRTELQVALPIRLGQVFGAWAGAVERDRWRLSKVRERLRTVALGGTAVGTAFGATRAYLLAAERHLRRITRLPLSRSQNLPDEVANADKYAELAQAAALCAGNVRKISSDLLLYGSSGLGELRHPELQFGSTIMPAKANPVLLEAAKGLAIDAEHEAAKVSAYAFEGQLQLNAWLPFLAEALLACFESLSRALEALVAIVPLLEVEGETMARNLRSSNLLLNLLVPRLGYNRVKELFRELSGQAAADDSAYLDLVAAASGLPRAELALAFGAQNATSPGSTAASSLPAASRYPPQGKLPLKGPPP